MNNEQKKAIKSLERAFKKCSDADLCFMGEDGDLICFDSYEFGKAEEKLELENKLYGPGNILSVINYSVIIKTHNTYMDSGGA